MSSYFKQFEYNANLALTNAQDFLRNNTKQSSRRSQELAVKKLNQVRREHNQPLYVPSGFMSSYNQLSPSKESLQAATGPSNKVLEYIQGLERTEGITYDQALNRVNDIRAFHKVKLFDPTKGKNTPLKPVPFVLGRTRFQTKNMNEPKNAN